MVEVMQGQIHTLRVAKSSLLERDGECSNRFEKYVFFNICIERLGSCYIHFLLLIVLYFLGRFNVI